MRRVAFLLLFIGVTAPVAGQQSSIAVASSFERLTITNATRGGQVIVAGMSIQSERGVRRLRRFAEVLTDSDGDGRIEYVPEGKVPRRSIWLAADLESGAVATVGGPALSGYLAAVPETAPKKDADGFVTGFESAGVEMDILLIQPKKGAWIRHAYEGNDGDEDGVRNGTIRALFASATPLAPVFGAPPTKARKDDLLAVIDIRRLRLGVTTIVR
jgi:hypothetical protein